MLVELFHITSFRTEGRGYEYPLIEASNIGGFDLLVYNFPAGWMVRILFG